MRCALGLAVVLACVPPAFAQPIGPPPPDMSNPGPTLAALQQIEARRTYLKTINLWDTGARGGLKQAEVAKALEQLEAALRSRDAHVFAAAVQDVSNSQYQSLPADAIIKLLRPTLNVPETGLQRVTSQGYIMEHLARWYGAKAKEVLPDLLRIVTDGRAHFYLRGQAIDAAARIAPGDKAVVDALIAAASDADPKRSTGVQDRIAERLGEMGKAAAPAKAVLLKMFERDPMYMDNAALALGKIGLDDPPRPLGDYLDRLATPDRIPLERAAAAFIHVQKACLPDAALRPPNYMALQPRQVNLAQALKNLDRKHTAAARPVLFKIVADRPGNDIYIRSALRTMAVIGPGSSPEAARVLVDVLTRTPVAKTHQARNEARAALALFEPANPAAVPHFATGIAALAKDEPHEWVSRCTLAQVIGRYGKDASQAAAVLIRNLERFRSPPTMPVYPAYEEMAACVDALAAAGGDVPGGRTIVLQLLDPDGSLLKKAGPTDPTVQASLLLALSRMGLPKPGEERDAVLDVLHGGLASHSGVVVSAAASFIVHNGSAVSTNESRTIVPWLVRVLKGDAAVKADHGSGSVPLDFGYDQPMAMPRTFAARALAALGPRARDALPALEAVAGQPLVDVRNTYLAEPPMNFVIREARKAVEAIR